MQCRTQRGDLQNCLKGCYFEKGTQEKTMFKNEKHPVLIVIRGT